MVYQIYSSYSTRLCLQQICIQHIVCPGLRFSLDCNYLSKIILTASKLLKMFIKLFE